MFVRNLGIGLSVKQAISKTTPSGNRHGCEFDGPADITQRKNTGAGSALVLIDCNVSLFACSDPDLVEIERFRVGDTASSHQNSVGTVNDLPVDECEILLSALAVELDLCNAARVAMNSDSLLLHLRVKRVRNIGVKLTKSLGLSHDQVRLSTQGIQDTSQFDSNVAGTDNHDYSGNIFEFKETIRRNAVLGDSFAWRHAGTTSDRNEDIFGSQRLFGTVVHLDTDGVSVNKSCVTCVCVAPRPVETARVNVVELDNVRITLLLESGPVDLGLGDGESILCGVVIQRFGDGGCHPHDFLRNAADIDAGSSETSAFDDGNLFTITGGTLT
mmetsp:Transcript_14818/g.24511  ORF Transcript_14818/g.24511 Transcript_14818/m.24511 type:complete len:329 (-) Transcript_14818:104-1090(-)